MKQVMRSESTGCDSSAGELTSLDVLRQETPKLRLCCMAYIHDFGMDYEEVLRIDAAAVDALGDLRGTESIRDNSVRRWLTRIRRW